MGRIYTPIDDAMSSTSTNPVQNSVLKKYIDDTAASAAGGVKITLDTSMSSTSTNGVQNKIIKKYVDDSKVILDTSMSDSSLNGVQNRVIKSFVEDYFAKKSKNLYVSCLYENFDAKTVFKNYTIVGTENKSVNIAEGVRDTFPSTILVFVTVSGIFDINLFSSTESHIGFFYEPFFVLESGDYITPMYASNTDNGVTISSYNNWITLPFYFSGLYSVNNPIDKIGVSFFKLAPAKTEISTFTMSGGVNRYLIML